MTSISLSLRMFPGLTKLDGAKLLRVATRRCQAPIVRARVSDESCRELFQKENPCATKRLRNTCHVALVASARGPVLFENPGNSAAGEEPNDATPIATAPGSFQATACMGLPWLLSSQRQFAVSNRPAHVRLNVPHPTRNFSQKVVATLPHAKPPTRQVSSAIPRDLQFPS